ncbi:hypothetical protein HPB48_026412 [Haemaphysalis longicornis]|uniref:Exonuclease domain-containing protein n=1 Tax=Haemaphysalis longicornis TaxID=44386 RepID=A0A9J6HCA4_HAELO|nr:hypothetical protein HPB48_026412 [Haemaphysalis longicornis]
MKRQHPSSHKTATRQGHGANARDVDGHCNRTYPLAAGDGLFLLYVSSAQDDLQKPPTDAICSTTRRSADQLAGTSPLRRRTHDLYDQLLRYAVCPQELDRCGYPRLCPEKLYRVLFMERGEKAYSSRKTCSTWRASFGTTHTVAYYAKSACSFHTGRCSAIGFSCCEASADHPGCNSSYYHVCPLGARDKWDAVALAFVCPSRRNGGAREVFALHCEMSFTIHGFEVARAALLRLFNRLTVFVGHGLENDLRVLIRVHDRVDLAMVFPHHRGLPYRQSLRLLIGGYLNCAVPNEPLGHDSVEDAMACMKLMLWKEAHGQELRDILSRWSGGRQRQPSE